MASQEKLKIPETRSWLFACHVHTCICQTDLTIFKSWFQISLCTFVVMLLEFPLGNFTVASRYDSPLQFCCRRTTRYDKRFHCCRMNLLSESTRKGSRGKSIQYQNNKFKPIIIPCELVRRHIRICSSKFSSKWKILKFLMLATTISQKR